jgi:Tol biopolymer transport system component
MDSLEEREEWPNGGMTSYIVGMAPDGSAVAYRSGRLNEELNLMNLDGTGRRKIFAGPEKEGNVITKATWSRDGKWIYFGCGGNIKRIPANGGQAQTVYEGQIFYPGHQIHPDGRRISFLSIQSVGTIWALDNAGRVKVQ